LVAKQLGQGEPLDRLAITPLVGRNHPRQARSHLRPQGDLPATFIGEIVELADYLGAAFEGEEFQGLQRGTVVFAKTVTPRRAPPMVKNVLARVSAPKVVVRERLGIKIAKTGQTFHKSCGRLR